MNKCNVPKKMSGSNVSGTTNENNTVHFKEWVTAILSVTKTEALLPGMDACN